MHIEFATRTILRSLIGIALLLIAMHIVSLYLFQQSENQITEVLIEKFSLEGESNFPAFFSSMILLFSAVLFAIIGKAYSQRNQEGARHWLGLGAIFTFLSLDEAAQIHEKLDTDLIWASFDTSGLLAWPWVILYGALAMVVAILYLRFWLRLPLFFRISYGFAAALYVGSALGFEMLEALEYTTQGGVTDKYILLTSTEEILEIAAILFLIATNFKYIERYLPDMSMTFSTPNRVNAG